MKDLWPDGVCVWPESRLANINDVAEAEGEKREIHLKEKTARKHSFGLCPGIPPGRGTRGSVHGPTIGLGL